MVQKFSREPYDEASRPTEFLSRPTEFLLRPTEFFFHWSRRSIASFAIFFLLETKKKSAYVAEHMKESITFAAVKGTTMVSNDERRTFSD
jgi:hypothetical protein